MCGRIAQFSPSSRLARYFDAELAADVGGDDRAGWNVAPTRTIAGVTALRPEGACEPSRLLDTYRWGLIPSEAKNPSPASRLFVARGESVTTRSSFRNTFVRRRVIVPVDGFYEWRKGPGRRRQPHFFQRADGAPLALGGLWDVWHPRRQDAPQVAIRSCTIITTSAGQDIDGIHDRMPLVLEPATFDVWLDPANDDREELRALLRPAPGGTLRHHAVDPRVGNVRNDDPGLIEEVPEGRTGARARRGAGVGRNGRAPAGAGPHSEVPEQQSLL